MYENLRDKIPARQQLMLNLSLFSPKKRVALEEAKIVIIKIFHSVLIIEN